MWDGKGNIQQLTFNSDKSRAGIEQRHRRRANNNSCSVEPVARSGSAINLRRTSVQPELKLLSFYKVLEFFAPIVMALDSNEAMRKKLDSPSTLKPDANFLKSIFELARSLEQRRKDKEMIRQVLETCMDFVDVANLLPKPLAKELSHDDKKGQSEHIRFVSEALVATRNQVAHAKSNYEPLGNEVSEEYLPQLNEFVQAAAVRTIRWYNRLPVHLKLKF
jgi:hypothetical protein